MNTVSNEKSDGPKKKLRFCLHDLQSSSSCKENLVGAGRIPHQIANDGKTDKPEQMLLETEVCDSVNETSSVAIVHRPLSKQLITDNLNSVAGPIENYWEVTAERLRKSLEKELEESARLHATVFALEKENLSCKVLIENNTNLLDTLKEFINKSQSSSDNDESFNEQEESTPLSTRQTVIHSSVKHWHKKIKKSNSNDSDSN